MLGSPESKTPLLVGNAAPTSTRGWTAMIWSGVAAVGMVALVTISKTAHNSHTLEPLWVPSNVRSNSYVYNPSTTQLNSMEDDFDISSMFSTSTGNWKQMLDGVINNKETKANFFGMQIKAKDSEEMMDSLKNATALTDLTLTLNPITNVGAVALADAWKSGLQLSTLDVSICQIGDEGASALSDVMKGSSTLKAFSIENNQVADEGVKAICEALKSNTVLEELYLSSNYISSEGAKYIADALKSNKSLKVLKLLGNRIQTEGAIVLAEALLENSSLEELGLSENQISDDAAPAIINMLKSNTSLKKLSLAGGNDITNGFKTKIQNASGETKVSF